MQKVKDARRIEVRLIFQPRPQVLWGAGEGTEDQESQAAAAADQGPPAADGIQLVPPGLEAYDPKTDPYLK
eukprot:8962801-Karenia_brevis.AAC.1